MSNQSRPEGMTDFESILEKNSAVKYTEKWHPISVGNFENELTLGSFQGMSRELRKNIAYALQYLEYIQLQLREIHLHDVIKKHLFKTYIVTSMGIIEGVFFHLVTKNGCQKKTDWITEGKPVHTNVFRVEGIEKKYIISTESKLDKPQDIQMDFEYLINKVLEKKLISLTHKAFPHLKALKRLRNKVHLHVSRYTNDTDYLGITECDYLLARYILFSILRDKVFSPQEDTSLSYLMITPEEVLKINKYLERVKEDSNNG